MPELGKCLLLIKMSVTYDFLQILQYCSPKDGCQRSFASSLSGSTAQLQFWPSSFISIYTDASFGLENGVSLQKVRNFHPLEEPLKCTVPFLDDKQNVLALSVALTGHQ